MRAIGTLHSPVFIIDSTFGWARPASRAISFWVLWLCSMVFRRNADLGETGVGLASGHHTPWKWPPYPVRWTGPTSTRSTG